MLEARACLACAVLGGKLYAVGGNVGVDADECGDRSAGTDPQRGAVDHVELDDTVGLTLGLIVGLAVGE